MPGFAAFSEDGMKGSLGGRLGPFAGKRPSERYDVVKKFCGVSGLTGSPLWGGSPLFYDCLIASSVHSVGNGLLKLCCY